jgi:hypothetical protein
LFFLGYSYYAHIPFTSGSTCTIFFHFIHKYNTQVCQVCLEGLGCFVVVGKEECAGCSQELDPALLVLLHQQELLSRSMKL